MKIISALLAVLVLVVVVTIGTLTRKDFEQTPLMKLKEMYPKKQVASVDHSRFAQLDGPFRTPQEVTAACIGCHNKRHLEVMQSNHWNWERAEYEEGRGIVYLGKKNAINNFCIGTRGNEQSCAKCHIGYGMDSKGTVFTDSTNIDCLVCHDNTETYVKGSERGGLPSTAIDLRAVAMNVGKSTRSTCGTCHFFGGGGNNVKHGDLDMAMFEPSKDLDIHMASDGADLRCTDCHTTKRHNIAGKVYSLSSMNRNRNSCEDCHGETPHAGNVGDVLNEHTLKVACQSCHIPTYARANATKMYWDWSTAGKLKDGKPYTEEDSLGNHIYMSIKGSFTWQKDVKPDYVWFNGRAAHYLEGDTINNPGETLILNRLFGSYQDEDSKIIPVKIHKARQPYDPVNKILVKPRLFAEKKGEGALWKDFDWNLAAENGMRDAGLPYSGQLDFIETAMYWPVNHMVTSKENTLSCTECHSRENSRLAGLTDFYLPGRDRSEALDRTAGWLMILILTGIVLHGSARGYVHHRNNHRRRSS